MEAEQSYLQARRHATRRGEFTVTEQHITLLRAALVEWDPCEFGAPEIDPKKPYGNSAVEHDIRRVLGNPAGSDEDMTRLHAETGIVLQIVLSTGMFEPGRYVCDQFGFDWKRADHG